MEAIVALIIDSRLCFHLLAYLMTIGSNTGNGA